MNKMLCCNNYTFTPVARWCLEEVLKLEDYFINVNSCVFLDCKSGEFRPPECIFISQDLEFPENIRCMFHELRHYYQFKKGIYDFNPKDFLPVLKPEMSVLEKHLEQYLAYQKRPWELDANEFAMETMRQFYKTPEYETFRLQHH